MSKVPRVLIVVEGGVVQNVIADATVEVHILDHDDLDSGEDFEADKTFPVAYVAPEAFDKELNEHAGIGCSGANCENKVLPGENYYSSPCGTYCEGCMEKHMEECEICRKEFK